MDVTKRGDDDQGTVLSLKKHMDAHVEELLRSALDSYKASLSAMGKYGTQAYPQLGQELQQSLTSLQEHLSSSATPTGITQTQQQVEEQLQQWSARASEYFKHKAEEIKEIMIILARTAQSVSDRDQRYTSQFSEFTTRLETIAGLEDLTKIRKSLLESASELKDNVEKMEQDGRQAIKELRSELSAYQTKLQEAEQLASRDELTGLDNRREIERQLDQRVKKGRKFCIMMFDLNGFKSINDAHGHLAGDQLLKQFAGELRSFFWPANVVGRWGGDEFIAILDCELGAAKSRLGSARKWVFGDYKIDSSGGSRKVAIGGAIGLAEWKPGETVRDVLGRADTAMYKEKAPDRG